MKPEPMRLYLYHEPIKSSSFGSLDWLGWSLLVSRLSPQGEEIPHRDHWDFTLLEVLQYLGDYSDEEVNWRWEQSGEPANLIQLQPQFDASKRFETALKVVVSPGQTNRLCFNLYDDSGYRYTLEELYREGELEAWIPNDWSIEYPDLKTAESSARKSYSWCA